MNDKIGRCKDCKWWQPDVVVDVFHPDWGICMLGETSGYEPKYPKSRAFAVDADAYYARLATAPNFGCVQFEAKDEHADVD